jgi:hypothetical protein
MDNYFIGMAAVDYMIEELNIKIDNTSGNQVYGDDLIERNKTLYNSVKLKRNKNILIFSNVIRKC